MKIKAPLLLLCCVLPLGAGASGSYTARPPRPPAQKDTATGIDNDKYALGKSLFTGKTKLKPNAEANAAQQELKLKELAGRLPQPMKEAEKLPGLAGKLSTKQMEALEYYLAQRYKLN